MQYDVGNFCLSGTFVLTFFWQRPTVAASTPRVLSNVPPNSSSGPSFSAFVRKADDGSGKYTSTPVHQYGLLSFHRLQCSAPQRLQPTEFAFLVLHR